MRFPIESSPAEATLRGFRLSKSHRFFRQSVFFPEADFIAGLPAARQSSTAGSARCREPVLRPLSCPPRSGGAAPQPRCATGAMRRVWSENASLPSCPPPSCVQHLFFSYYTRSAAVYT